MKGQQEAVSVVLITGILIGVVGSVYFWGLPLIQKNKDITVLKDSERFMGSLDDKIKSVANNGGRDQILIDVPGILVFDPQSNPPELRLRIDTQGTIYDTGGWIPLGRNDCSKTTGDWGTDEPSTLCVKSEGEKDKYFTTYRLEYLILKGTGAENYVILLSGSQASGGEGHKVVMENTGSLPDGKTSVVITIV